ncbi:MAG: hypothetical protein AB3N23_02505, partial [Paracoccaceae bacterium]
AEVLTQAMAKGEIDLPVRIGGRLNQIPEGSNTSLPVDVTADLVQIGVIPCPDLNTASAVLRQALSPSAKR